MSLLFRNVLASEGKLKILVHLARVGEDLVSAMETRPEVGIHHLRLSQHLEDF